MHHVALMKKEWGFIEKILSGEKTVESRWYKIKRTPFGIIKKRDVIYFKNSGEPVLIKADVRKVIQLSELNHKKVKNLLNNYNKQIGINKNNIAKFFKKFSDKRYCILIFLKNPKKVTPFQIDKKGFGNMAAWITINNINTIKNNG